MMSPMVLKWGKTLLVLLADERDLNDPPSVDPFLKLFGDPAS
jgi:hypothetical protein